MKEILARPLKHSLLLLGNKFKFDSKFTFRSVSILFFGHIINAISGFILTLGLVRFLTQEEYGMYSYIFALIGTAGAFTLSGIDTATTQAIAKGHDSTLHKSFKIKLLWNIPVMTVCFCIGAYYLYNNNLILGWSMIGFASSILFLYPTSLYSAYLNGKKQFFKLTTDSTFRNVSTTIGMLAIAYITRDVLFTFFTYLLIMVIISSYRYIKLSKRVTTVGETDNQSISLGKHLSIIKMFTTLMAHIDKLIIFQLLGVNQLAIYAIALAPIKQVQGLSKVIEGVVTPKFAIRSLNEIKSTIWHKVALLFIFYSSAGLMYFLFAPYFFTILFPGYDESIIYSQYLALVVLFLPLLIFSNALVAQHKKKQLYALSFVKPLFKIIPLIVLVPMFGLWGAVLSYLIFIMLHTTLTTILFMFSKQT